MRVILHQKSLLSRAALLLLLCMTAAAAALAQTRDRGDYGTVELSEKDYHLIETAEEMHDQFQRRGLRHSDRELEAWLQAVGNRLTPPTTDFYQDYRFYLIRDPSPNAFALPDGQIYVHSGLLGRLENEAQLAALLAHEINHVAGHHGIMAFRSQQKKAAAGFFFSIVGAAAGGWGDLAGSLINVGLVTSMFGYSRELEQEADTKGYELMLAAGYDVREMPGLFVILGHDFEGLNPRMAGKWSTHPDLISRGKYTSGLVANTPDEELAGLVPGGDDFRSRVRPLALDTVRDYILADYPKTALELARSLTAEDPTDYLAWNAAGDAYIALGARSEYSADSALSDKEKKAQVRIRSKLTRDELHAQAAKSPEAKTNIDHNLTQAEQSFQTALALQDNAQAHAGLGEIYLRRDRYRDSARELMAYLKLSPDAPDRGLIMDDLRDIAQQLKADSGE